MSLACGIDVGGTKIAGGVVDENGTILEELRVESPATDVPATEPNSIQMFAGSPTTGTQQIDTQQIDPQPMDTQPIDTQHIGTTLGIHSPGGPQS